MIEDNNLNGNDTETNIVIDMSGASESPEISQEIIDDLSKATQAQLKELFEKERYANVIKKSVLNVFKIPVENQVFLADSPLYSNGVLYYKVSDTRALGEWGFHYVVTVAIELDANLKFKSLPAPFVADSDGNKADKYALNQIWGQ